MKTLKENDYKTILNNSSYISNVSPMMQSAGQYINGANNYPSSLMGVSPDYLEIRKLELGEGSMFTERDVQTSAKVCVVGKTIVDNLFPGGDGPIGKVIMFNKIQFTIIGTLKAKGYNSMGQDQDDVVIAPYATVMKRVLEIDYIQGIFALAISGEKTDETIAEVTEMLRRNHKLRDGEDDDFMIRLQQELSSMLSSTTDMMTILLSCMAGISLLVGGISIMNIMCVSVTERTREICLRMSIGVRGRDILAQFQIESVIISVTGCIIGVIFGCGATFVVKIILNLPISIQLYSVVLSFLVCTITGVFFGWYPAKKASNLDPIEAIRLNRLS